MSSFQDIQHDLNNPLYMMLYQLTFSEPVKHILEIGSADGSGSTRILEHALRDKEATLYCLEAEPSRFQKLKTRYESNPQIKVFPYLSVFPAQFPKSEQIESHWHDGQSLLKRYPLQEVKKWYDGEQLLAESCKPVSGIEHIKTKHEIEHFDLVLLDGAEFLGKQDYEAVKGSSILVLDDTESYKNQSVLQELLADSDYQLLYYMPNWGHGCAAFKKKRNLKPGISVVVHTLNEEEHIESLLKNLNLIKELVSEIIVVDMYSDDQTRKKISDLNIPHIRIISHLPVSGVDMARNFGLSQVNYQWTLVLDADERLSEDLALFLNTHFSEILKGEVDAFWWARKNIFFGVPVPHLSPDYQLRFFRSYTVSWPGGVHKYPVVKGSQIQLAPHLLIEHYSYKNVGDFIQRQKYYAEVFWDSQATTPEKLRSHLPELRKKYTERSRQTLRHLETANANNHEWLVHHLYLFSELCQLSEAMERSGSFNKLSYQKPRLSAYGYIKNGVLFDYPFCESLLSILPVCDEVVVTYAVDSEDNTEAILKQMTLLFPHLRVYPSEVWSKTQVLNGERIRMAANESMSYCQGEWLWHVQSDEVYTRKDALKVKDLVYEYHAQKVDCFLFKINHFYGNYEQFVGEKGKALGWYMACIRLARRGATQHIGDAWTQQVHDGATLHNTDVTIFHYGHVREPEAMRIKSNHMEKLYKVLPENFEVCPENEFVYDRVPPAYLNTFQNYHPLVMARRVAQFSMNQKKRTKKPKALIISRLPGLKKGYGITFQTLYQSGVLQKHFDVHHLAWHYYEDTFSTMGITVHPDNRDKIKDPERLKQLLYELEPDVVLLHADMHYFVSYQNVLKAWKGPVVGWFTVDYEQKRNPPTLTSVLNRCDRVIGLAEFGITQLKKDYQGPMGKVPLGVDTKLFKPVSQEQKENLRAHWKIPQDAFVFLTVANNFWRKGIEYAVESFATYCERYPEAAKNSYLYLHTEKSVELAEQVMALGLQRKIFLTPDYDPIKAPLSGKELAQLYQFSDAFLLTTLGEGFGMTLLEAQASGLPVIVSQNSVTEEVTQNNAVYIPCPTKITGKTGGRMVWLRCPDTEKAAFLMHDLYQNTQKRFQIAEKALEDIRFYDWETSAYLLTGQLALALENGKLVFEYPQPKVQAI